MHQSLLAPLLHSLAIFSMVLVQVHYSLVGTIALSAPLFARNPLCTQSVSYSTLSIQIGDLHTDIKKITDNFFALGPIANFLHAFLLCCGDVKTAGATFLPANKVKFMAGGTKTGIDQNNTKKY